MGGDHSTGQQWPYYRSLVGWFLPWMLIAAVVGIAVWVAIDVLGQGELKAPPPRQRTAAVERPSPSPSPSRSPSTRERAEPERDKDRVKDHRIERTRRAPKKDKENEKERAPALITDGITVQVLNATASPGAAGVMSDRLESLGYDVVALESASGSYPQTVVFWSFPDAQRAAEALADRYGWEASPRPANLSPTVDLHVVVGDDEV